MRGEREEEAGGLGGLMAFAAGVICHRPRLVLAAVVLSTVASVYYTAVYLEYQTQRSDLLNPQKDSFQRWKQYLAEFGDDDDMVVVIEGKDAARMREAIEALARRVSAQPEYFDRLFYKVDLSGLENRALLFLPSEQIRAIQDGLKNMSLLLETPVLSRLDPLVGWKAFTILQLVQEAERRASAWSGDAKLSPADEQFIRQLTAICSVAADMAKNPAAYKNPWESILPTNAPSPAEFRGRGSKEASPSGKSPLAEPKYFFSADGSLAFLLARPKKEENSFTGAQKSIEALQQIIAEVKTELTPPAPPSKGRERNGIDIGLTGLPVLENDEMIASNNDATLASWLALAGVALLYLIVYRGIRYPFFTVASLLVGTAWALGWLTLTVGHLNILSSAFAVMLIGMGDYGVLWVTRHSQERAEGADLLTATRRTAAEAGPSILTAATTTALAFFAAMLADFKAVSELGWIAGSGILLCALSCFIVVPALVAVFDFKQRRMAGAGRSESPAPAVLSLEEKKSALDAATWLPALARRPKTVIACALSVTFLLAWCAWHIRYDHNILHLQATSLDSVQWEEKLLSRIAGTSWYAVSYTTTPEEALALKMRFEKLPAVGEVAEIASLVPREQERKLEQLRDIQYRLRSLPERGVVITHVLPRPAELERALGRLSIVLDQVAQPVGLRRSARLGDLRTEVDKLREAVTANPDAAATRLRDFEERLTRDLADDLHRLRDLAQPLPITLADLPEGLRERFIGRSGKWLVRIFGKESLWDYGPLSEFVAQVQTVDPEATGRPFNTLEGLRSMKNGFLRAALYALLAMVAVLFVDFRNLRHTLVSLAPLAMGMIVTLGIMALCGVALNPANMIALPLILGVGADNGVHVLHDYRARRRGRRYNLSRVTGQAIMVASLTTILGFGTLMIARHRGMYSLGFMLTLGVSCCMLTALVFLPALLRLLSTRHAEDVDYHKSRHVA